MSTTGLTQEYLKTRTYAFPEYYPRAMRVNRTTGSGELPKESVSLAGRGCGELAVAAEFLQQHIRCREPIESDPGSPRGRAHQGHRSVAHLVTAVDLKGPLRGEAGRHRARVVLPAGTRSVALRVLAQPCRGILFRIDRDRDHVSPLAGVSTAAAAVRTCGFMKALSSIFELTSTFSTVILYVPFTPCTAVSSTYGIIRPFTARSS